jgi:hypothetical protein
MLAVAAAVLVLLPIALINIYLILRTLPFAMSEPKSVEAVYPGEAPPGAVAAIERLGFSLAGRMEFAAPQKNAAPSWQWALCSDDHRTLAVLGSVNTHERGAFVTVWPDGAVVVSRWPKFLWIRERRVPGALATTNPTVADAYAKHREEVAAFGRSIGAAMVVRDLASAQACLKVGSGVYRSLMGRTTKIVFALAGIGLAVSFVALVVRI